MSFIGGAVKANRQRAKMTGKALAEQTRLSRQYITDIEMGRRIPPPETVLNIANVFPEVDSTWWLWLLLRDSWGNETAELMRRHAVACYLGDED